MFSVSETYAAHIFVSFPFPLFGKKVGVPRTLESAMLVTKCVRDVQELKTHASESGQMHAQHLAICGQVTKKKCTVSRPKMKIQGLSKQLPIFLLQKYRSARQSPVQNGVLGLEKQLQIFHFLCLNMAALFYTHTEVCCKICKQRTIYVRNFTK